MTARAAPAYFPYPHRTMAQVMAEEGFFAVENGSSRCADSTDSLTNERAGSLRQQLPGPDHKRLARGGE